MLPHCIDSFTMKIMSSDFFRYAIYFSHYIYLKLVKDSIDSIYVAELFFLPYYWIYLWWPIWYQCLVHHHCMSTHVKMHINYGQNCDTYYLTSHTHTFDLLEFLYLPTSRVQWDRYKMREACPQFCILNAFKMKLMLCTHFELNFMLRLCRSNAMIK